MSVLADSGEPSLPLGLLVLFSRGHASVSYLSTKAFDRCARVVEKKSTCLHDTEHDPVCSKFYSWRLVRTVIRENGGWMVKNARALVYY